MKRIITNPILGIILLSFVSTTSAKDLGTVGNVYNIAEKDSLQEMKRIAKDTNINKMFNKDAVLRKLKSYNPTTKELRSLEPAKADRSFLVDMSYTLDQDLTDGKGTVIYPKGFTFNPLDYVKYPKIIVILDGNSPKQVGWFKQSPYFPDPNVSLLLTDGSYGSLSKGLKRPVFYATPEIAGVFQIHKVPSIVRQKGNMMEVIEVAVSNIKVSSK